MILLSMVCCAVPSPYSSPAGSSAAQRAVTDGVSAESKESIAGYLRLALGNAEEAIKIAQACLVLAYGGQIEMRPVADLCRPMAEIKAQAKPVRAPTFLTHNCITITNPT
jgi:hypothetical protein